MMNPNTKDAYLYVMCGVLMDGDVCGVINGDEWCDRWRCVMMEMCDDRWRCVMMKMCVVIDGDDSFMKYKSITGMRSLCGYTAKCAMCTHTAASHTATCLLSALMGVVLHKRYVNICMCVHHVCMCVCIMCVH